MITEGFDPKLQNDAVNRWASMVVRYLRGSANTFVHGKDSAIERPGRQEKVLADSIYAKSRSSYGIIDRASFSFERHGVFVHKGVGRGYEMKGVMVIRTAREEDDPARHVGAKHYKIVERKPVDWFNPVLNQTLPELANKLAEINADAVVNATKMMIK
jgi:hypothetical protein